MALWLEFRTRDRKVSGSCPPATAAGEFSSPGSTFCSDPYFGIFFFFLFFFLVFLSFFLSFFLLQILLFVYRDHKDLGTREPRTSTSVVTQPLSSGSSSMLLYVHRDHKNY